MNLAKRKRAQERRDIRDFLLVLLGGGIVHLAAIHLKLFDDLYALTRRRPDLQLEALFAVAVYMTLVLMLFAIRRWREALAAQAAVEQRNRELEAAMGEIRQLRGILPICASCKKIRDDHGFWHAVESYVQNHSKAEFSHSICPDCRQRLYPEFSEAEDAAS